MLEYTCLFEKIFPDGSLDMEIVHLPLTLATYRPVPDEPADGHLVYEHLKNAQLSRLIPSSMAFLYLHYPFQRANPLLV